jgi:hypothetical protein
VGLSAAATALTALRGAGETDTAAGGLEGAERAVAKSACGAVGERPQLPNASSKTRLGATRRFTPQKC